MAFHPLTTMSVAVYVLFSCFFHYFRPVLGYDIALESDAWSTCRLVWTPDESCKPTLSSLMLYMIDCAKDNLNRDPGVSRVQNVEISKNSIEN